jgi:hypothetical protein
VVTHTYTNNCDVDLIALSTYPSDDKLENVAKIAYKEAENLWTLLGAPPSSTHNSSTRSPSIHAWFKQTAADSGDPTSSKSEDEEDFGSDYESCVGDSDLNDEEESESTQIQQALDYLEKVSVKYSRDEDEINGLALAAVALSVGNGMSMDVLNTLLSFTFNLTYVMLQTRTSRTKQR